MATTLHDAPQCCAAPAAHALAALEAGFSQWVFALGRTLITTPVGCLLTVWFCWQHVPHHLTLIWSGRTGQALSVLITALDVAERLRVGVEASPLLTTPVVTVTVSVGAAALAPGSTAEDLLNAADASVYAAKRGGRDVRSSTNLTPQV